VRGERGKRKGERREERGEKKRRERRGKRREEKKERREARGEREKGTCSSLERASGETDMCIGSSSVSIGSTARPVTCSRVTPHVTTPLPCHTQRHCYTPPHMHHNAWNAKHAHMHATRQPKEMARQDQPFERNSWGGGGGGATRQEGARGGTRQEGAKEGTLEDLGNEVLCACESNRWVGAQEKRGQGRRGEEGGQGRRGEEGGQEEGGGQGRRGEEGGQGRTSRTSSAASFRCMWYGFKSIALNICANPHTNTVSTPFVHNAKIGPRRLACHVHNAPPRHTKRAAWCMRAWARDAYHATPITRIMPHPSRHTHHATAITLDLSRHKHHVGCAYNSEARPVQSACRCSLSQHLLTTWAKRKLVQPTWWQATLFVRRLVGQAPCLPHTCVMPLASGLILLHLAPVQWRVGWAERSGCGPGRRCD